jgi:tetratricopeptide (TPR) repeat protein
MHLFVMALMLAAEAKPPATAASVVEKVAEARKACASGRVERGIALLAEIVTETGDPNALFNQARCYQQNGRAEQAINRFREYLRTAPNIPADEAERIRGFIKELEGELEAKARREAAAKQAAAVVAPPTFHPAPAALAESVVESPPTEHPGRALRVAGVVLAVAGVAAVGAGAYFGWRMTRTASDLEMSRTLTPMQFKKQWDDGKQSELLARIGYATGGAALVAAAACYLVGRSAGGRPEPRVALVPVVGPTGGGGLLRVGF